jgi:branched-chain amino acid transport system ATP-binding protein
MVRCRVDRRPAFEMHAHLGDLQRPLERQCRHLVTGLCKRFGGIVVADAIDLTVPAGRIVGLIGPNGAGKTSFFNLVSGVVPPDAGRVVLDGKDVTNLKVPERARLGLVRTWQNLRLFPSLSVIDNLLIGTRDYPGERVAALAFHAGRVRRTGREDRLKALDVLERTGLAGIADTEIANVPYGQQKPVAAGHVAENVRNGITFVGQGHNVFPTLSVERNLRIAGLLFDQTFATEVLRIFPVLEERRHQRAGSMSGGEQQMLALGMALMTRPKWLLLDEPSTGLAPVIVRNVMRQLREINETIGTGLIIVEQNVPVTLKIVERAIILKSAAVVFDGSAETLATKPDLWEWF